jgi:hypothetical protein
LIDAEPPILLAMSANVPTKAIKSIFVMDLAGLTVGQAQHAQRPHAHLKVL